ncbi:hypothetical protein QTO34_018136 [Cnephaeus nilssonii]|uniref:Large ribosomal subunit protein uL30-like ferredoxin-like fold domain-containing protein n=1 Tax=Cnephaeus nilssonii TaxID=3371016 RepID=A0AA40LPQ6_CNENI|nr:hypothetical protein QTO34_018136 [Eptesicus nilssonii]
MPAPSALSAPPLPAIFNITSPTSHTTAQAQLHLLCYILLDWPPSWNHEEGAEEKKEVPAVLETHQKMQRNSPELNIEHLRKKLPKRRFERIRGISGVSPKVQKVLQLLRLLQIFNSTFVKLNKALINKLTIVESHIAYNTMIAQTLGKYGIIYMEDMIPEIYTVGKRFKEGNSFLWSFKLPFHKVE